MDKDYIKECEECFYKQSIEMQSIIQQIDTDNLLIELKKKNWLMRNEIFYHALKYELMVRMDFKLWEE